MERSALSRLSCYPTLQPYLRLAPDKRTLLATRVRMLIEFAPIPVPIANVLLAATMPCVACGSTIHPIRERQRKQHDVRDGCEYLRHLYYAPTCPLDIKIGCSRGKKVTMEYDRVREEQK